MRRRSDRKKSVDPSPVTSSRRSSRRTSRRSPDVDSQEQEQQEQQQQQQQQQEYNESPSKVDSSPNRASSEERIESNNKRGRSTRTARGSAKRNLRSISGADNKIDAITEEENGIIANTEEEEEKSDNFNNAEEVKVENKVEEKQEEEESSAVEPELVVNKCEIVENVQIEKNTIETEEAKEAKEVVEEKTSETEKTVKFINEVEDVEMQDVSENKTNYNEEQKITEVLITGNAKVETEDGGNEAKDAAATEEEEGEVQPEPVEENTTNGKHEQIEVNEVHVEKKEHIKKLRTLSNHNNVVATTTTALEPNRTRKRKWLSKKKNENMEPILAISTDSLKNLIADVQPVPLSDVKLESSSEVEEVPSEHNAREISSSPSEHERRRSPLDKVIAEKVQDVVTTTTTISSSGGAATTTTSTTTSVSRTGLPLQSSPSPPRNQTSNVLFITNLVRPFTVMQLKGLLARTGKIVENGFWIDRIKSKCYVQYETEDEAIETRHALHGVRWPVSNPKCLNVDFGKLVDMERAIKLSNDDVPKYEKETKENYISSGNTWTREKVDEDERKDSKPIREWDVGKRDSRESRDVEKQRSPKENAGKEDKFKKGRVREREIRKSRSSSPARKLKKEDPPLRLLDDLFRKTRTTPCIYWLPLTPEQIAEKEAYRQKRIEERKERIKQRELEREKEQELERERERNRSRERDRSRERERSRDRSHERRRNRSSDRRRSRSRDRRRY